MPVVGGYRHIFKNYFLFMVYYFLTNKKKNTK